MPPRAMATSPAAASTSPAAGGNSPSQPSSRKRKIVESPAVQQAEMAAAKIVQFCNSQEGGVVRQELLEEKLGAVLAQDLMLIGLNRLMSQGRLVSIVRPNQKLSFKLQSAEEAAKLAGLSAEDRLVFQEVERASTAGISTKDLKSRASLQTPQLTRVLKKLEARKLVQHVK